MNKEREQKFDELLSEIIANPSWEEALDEALKAARTAFVEELRKCTKTLKITGEDLHRARVRAAETVDLLLRQWGDKQEIKDLEAYNDIIGVTSIKIAIQLGDIFMKTAEGYTSPNDDIKVIIGA